MKSLTIITLTVIFLSSSSCTENQPFASAGNVSKIPATPGISSTVASSDNLSLIEPGKRIGSLYLGANFDSAFSILGKPFFDNSYQPPVCSAREVRWLANQPNDDHPLLLAIFSSEDEIVQLQTELEGYETAEGVKNGDPLQDFMSKYDTKTLEVYADKGLKSNSKYVKGYSAYFIDSGRGIAFKFSRSRKDKRWYIESTSIFDPREDFSKWRYCISSDKTKWWIKLNTFDLDSSTELVDK